MIIAIDVCVKLTNKMLNKARRITNKVHAGRRREATHVSANLLNLNLCRVILRPSFVVKQERNRNKIYDSQLAVLRIVLTIVNR